MGTGNTKVRSDWVSGELYFYEKAIGRSATGDILKLGTSEVAIGNSAQDVDFIVYAGAADQYFKIDAAAATATFAKLDVAISGDLDITVEDIELADSSSLAFGDDLDVDIQWDGDSLNITPLTNDTGRIEIGNGTKDMDLIVFLGSAGESCLFDVGDSCVTLDAIDLKIDPGATTGKISFYDANVYIKSADDGKLTIAADGTSTDDITLSGSVDCTDTLTVAGILSVDNDTDTSSATTGSIHTDGGLGIAKALWVGTTSRLVGAVTCDAAVSIDDTTNSTSGATGSLQTDGGLGVALNTFLAGNLTVGVSGTGRDFTVYGATADYRVLFDANGDTNGALYVGADTKGIMFNLYGDTTGCGVFWDPSTDTNGTLSVGATGGSKGNDVIFYGDTSGSYLQWDQSANSLLLTKSPVKSTGSLPSQGLDYPYYAVGTSSSPIDITLSDNVVGFANWFQLKNSVAKTLLGAYFKVETDGANEGTLAQLVAVAPRVTVDMALDSAYGVQSHMTISGTKASSELINVYAYTELGTGARTADRVCALQAMISGSGTAGTVTGDAIVAYLVNAGTVITTDDICKIFNQSAATAADGLEIENDGTMTNAIKLNNDGTCATGILYEGTYTTGINFGGTFTDGIVFGGTVSDEAIQIGGTYDHGIRFSAAPVAGDNTNSFINIGDYGTALAVAPTSDNVFGVIQNVTLTDVNVGYWYQGYYTKITTAGTTTDTSIAGHAIRMVVGSSLGAVYGIQCHTNITATNTCATEIISVSAYVNLGSGSATTTDRVCALQAMIEGAGGTVTGDQVVAYLVNAGTATTTDAILYVKNQSACTATDAVRFDLDGTVTYAFKFDGTVCDAWSSGTGALNGADDYVLIPVRVEGVAQDLYIKAQKTWS